MKQWFTRWFNNQKLRVKFFFILLLALSLAFIGTLATSRMTDHAYNDALYERTVQLLTLFSQNVQSELDNVAESSFSIIADNVLQNSLTQLRIQKFASQKWISAQKDANNRLMNISLLHSDIVSIRLRALDGNNTEFYRIMPGAPIPSQFLDDHAAAARAAGGREIWISDENYPGTIFLVRDVREIADLTLNSIGMLAMRVNMDRLVSRCSNTLSNMGMPLLCTIDLKGTRVYASQEKMMTLNFEEKNFALHKTDDGTLFCVRYSPPNSKWVYIAALPYDDIMQSIRWSSGLSMAIAIGALALALTLGALLMTSILRHFQRLLIKYDAYAHGTLTLPAQPDPYENRQDEIGELHRHFDQMAMEHQQMIDEIYVKQQLLLEAQLRQLRAQIQPHFLYNTLESIYCLAEKGGDKRIATMTAALGRMLRATLKDKRDIITLAEDMEIAQEYLNIQLIRYGDQLQANFDIGEEFLSASIPAMTLQPLVENAVRHGAEEMLEPCEIRIFCTQKNEYIDLTVEDNGPGMEEDTLEKLERGEIKPEGLGIGLSNIHQRLRLAFKDESCGLRIQRKAEKTRVIVRILAQGGKKND